MPHDIVIRGGQVDDGSGREPIPADVAIDDGLITALGERAAAGVHVRDGELAGARRRVLRQRA